MDVKTKAKKCKYEQTTQEQLQFFMQFCREHPELQAGKNTPQAPRAMKELWEEVATNLNAMRGATRTAVKWKESLGHWKSQLRSRARKAKAEGIATGGGPRMCEISDFEQQAIETFGAVAVDGFPEVGVMGFQQAWLTFIDPYLAQCTSNYILKNNQSCIALKRFAEPYYIVEHGTRDEKLEFLSSCLDKGGSMKFTIQELENYVASVIRSFILIQSKLKSNNFESWTKNGYYSTESSLVSLAKNLTRNLVLNAGNCVDLSKLEHWLDRNPLFLILWREVFTKLYSFKAGQHTTLDRELSTVVIPVIEGLNDESNYAPLLDIPHIIFLNNNFHNERRHKWRFLFSSKVMGESFSTMLTKITNKGPTLLIIEDEDHYIFAGYAPASWSLSPLFVGDDTSMLFTLSPDMRCFSSSGYNDHYQYLNLNQKTMPNGLLFTGRVFKAVL